jgi:hypothetical protein
MNSVEDVVARIFRSERWRFGARNAEDAKQEIWVCVMEALANADATRGDVYPYLRFVATSRLRLKLARAWKRSGREAPVEVDPACERAAMSFRETDRSIEIRWKMRRAKPQAIPALTATVLIAQGVLIDEAATAVYHERSTREGRRRKLLEEVREYVGGAQHDDSRDGESFAEG